MKKVLIPIALALAAFALYSYKGLFLDDAAKGGEEFRPHEVVSGDISLTVIARGVVMPEVEVFVKGKAAGEIIEFPYKEGDRLEKGVVAVRLDPKTERTRTNQAEANKNLTEAKLQKAQVMLKDAETRLQRQQGLFNDGIISRQELDDAMLAHEKAKSDIKIAEAELRQATEALKEAEERLGDTEITAPLAGTILKKYVDVGAVISSTLSSVSEGTVLFSMADLTRMYVNALVDEVDVGKVSVGQEAGIKVDSIPQRQFTGIVERISPKGRVERTVTVFEVYIRIADKDMGLLRPGMTTDANIIAGVKKDIVMVPNIALKSEAGKNGVYVLQAGSFKWREVSIGETDGINTEALDGVKKGDTIGIPQPRQNKKVKRGFFF
jgi:HlyD family secretion protein